MVVLEMTRSLMRKNQESTNKLRLSPLQSLVSPAVSQTLPDQGG